jgi:hypothetical protein
VLLSPVLPAVTLPNGAEHGSRTTAFSIEDLLFETKLISPIVALSMFVGF